MDIGVGHAVYAHVQRGINALYVGVVLYLGQGAARADVQAFAGSVCDVIKLGNVLEGYDVIRGDYKRLHVGNNLRAALHQKAVFLILIYQNKRFIKSFRLMKAEIIENLLFHVLLLIVCVLADRCYSGHTWFDSILRRGKDSSGSP